MPQNTSEKVCGLTADSSNRPVEFKKRTTRKLRTNPGFTSHLAASRKRRHRLQLFHTMLVGNITGIQCSHNCGGSMARLAPLQPDHNLERPPLIHGPVSVRYRLQVNGLIEHFTWLDSALQYVR